MRGEITARPDLAARIGDMTDADVHGAVAIDLDAMPFAEATFDLVLSPLTLHWANDAPGVFIQLRRALKPDGLLIASVFGAETLRELRHALIEAELELRGGAALRVAPFADLQGLAGLLQRASFALPAADRDLVTVRYADPFRLLGDLREMGETSALAGDVQPLTRSVLLRALEIYRAQFADLDGRVRATFELLTATGWAPHESQQKALRPGSAKARLADALGVEEKPTGEKPGG